MLYLVIAFIIASAIFLAKIEDGGLDELAEKRHVNRLADESKKRRTGRKHKYSLAGIQK